MSAGTGQQNKQRKPLSAVVKFILAAGAVAAAITAIIALVQLILPDDDEQKARLHAQISQLKVDPKVPLAEFLERSGQAPKQRTTASTAVFVSATTAQYRTQTVVPPPPPVVPPPVPPPPPVVPPPPVPPPPASSSLGRLLEKVQTAPLDKVILFTLDPTVDVPPNAIPYIYTVVSDGAHDAPPEEVRQVLEASRLRVVTQSAGPPKLSPIGVEVNFSAEIEGYKGEKSVVRWSLFDAREDTRMPQRWLRDRKALELVPEAGSDSASQSLWVPLPRERGPYYVRIELFDDGGGRLAMADSEPFDER